jgi:hypothetical protein
MHGSFHGKTRRVRVSLCVKYFHILVFNVLLKRSTILALVSSLYVLKKCMSCSRIQVLGDMYRRVIPICMGRSMERQDGEDFKRRVAGHFQIGAAPDTFPDRQRN